MQETRPNIRSFADLSQVLQTLHDTGRDDIVLFGEKYRTYTERDLCFYKVEKLSYDEKYPMREAFENILLTLDDDAFNLIYIIDGTRSGISVYIGVVKTGKSASDFSAGNFGEIIRKSFESNYNGSILCRLSNDNEQLNQKILSSADRFRNAGYIVGIPGTNERESSENIDFQGMDRLINTMIGSEWRLMVVCEPVPKSEIEDLQNRVYSLYNRISMFSKASVQGSVNSGESFTKGENSSDTHGKNWSVSENHGSSKGHSSNYGSSGSSSDTNESRGTQSGASMSKTSGESISKGASSGVSSSVTFELTNKHVSEILKYIDDGILPRLNIGYTRGMYRTSVEYMASNPADAIKLKAGIMSLFKGEVSAFSSLSAVPVEIPKGKAAAFLNCFDSRLIYRNGVSDDSFLLNGMVFSDDYAALSTYLTPKEVSVIASLPQKEVPGLSLCESVEFGLNEKKIGENSIVIGSVMQRGRKLDIPFELDRNALNKHTFVAGVTGSGKTTTCQRLLRESGMPFLVIEPAKTEYRSLLNYKEYADNLVVFTLGNETVSPFRFNPFELVRGELLSSHIDTVKAAFTSAFPMEASMPQLLEEAIVRCYEKKGWSIELDCNFWYDDVFDSSSDAFPILSDLLVAMDEVVSEKNFGNELKNNYIGSLVSRISNLTTGSKGAMLNCPRSVNFDFILHNNVVLEMDEMKSPEDKSLIMGFVLMRLCAAVRNEHRQNNDFRHITLVEEAHRLLSRPDPVDGGARKSAVETFTDMLAEVRKYGEGLIIADQIPNKLAPDVLKNTNTKIIHKILAQDDKNAVGDTMLMDDKQKEYLSALPVGQAVIFSENTEKAVNVSIERFTDTNAGEITDEQVIARFNSVISELGCCYDDREYFAVYPLFRKLCKRVRNLKSDEVIYTRDISYALRMKELDAREAISRFVNKYFQESGKTAANPDRWQRDSQKVIDYFIRSLDDGKLISDPEIKKYI